MCVCVAKKKEKMKHGMERCVQGNKEYHRMRCEKASKYECVLGSNHNSNQMQIGFMDDLRKRCQVNKLEDEKKAGEDT